MPWRIAWCLLLLLPVAMAHGDSPVGDRVVPQGEFLNHVQPVEVELAPGESRNWTMAFGGPAGGGVLHEGWYWVLRADVKSPCADCPIRAALSVDGQPLEAWRWTARPQQEIVRVPFDGFLRLDLVNEGPENATVRFYYDVTCDCVGKVVPAPAGPVWFNTEADAGDEILFNFTVEPVQIVLGQSPPPGSITVRAQHLVPDDVGGFVPKQELLRTWQVGQEPSCDENRWTACFDFAFAAQEDGMQLVLVEAQHDAGPSWGTGLRPVLQPDGRDAPFALWLLPLGLALAYRRR